MTTSAGRSIRFLPGAVVALFAVFILNACAIGQATGDDVGSQKASRETGPDPAGWQRAEPDLSSTMATTRFAVERSLGAECHPYSGSASTWEFDEFLARITCYGKPPAHTVHALSSLPPNHPGLTDEMRERIARNGMHFLAVPGLGSRADFIVYLDDAHGMWARSFEGADQDTTVYMVFGPESNPDKPLLRSYRVYRVYKSGLPEDVTLELSPQAPTLTEAERKRYGPYVDDAVDAVEAKDTDVVLNPIELPYSPVMVWKLQQPESTRYGLTGSDPRLAGDYFHFGFLVWNGHRFVLEQKIRYTDIYCLKYPLKSDQDESRKPCVSDRDMSTNPFVIDDRIKSRVEIRP